MLKKVVLIFLVFAGNSIAQNIPTWKLVDTLNFPPAYRSYLIAIDSNTLLNYFGGKGFRSVDGGKNWEKISELLDGQIIASPNSSRIVLYRADKQMISESWDAGLNWTIIRDTAGELYGSYFIKLWSDKDASVFKWSLTALTKISTHDNFQTFSDPIVISDPVLVNIIPAKGVPNIIWLDSSHACCWVDTAAVITNDGGVTWKQCEIPLPDKVAQLKIGYGWANAGSYILKPNSSVKYFYFSTDYGVTWKIGNAPGYLRTIIPIGKNSFIATGWAEGQNVVEYPTSFYFSSDYGETWVVDVNTAQYFDLLEYQPIVVNENFAYARGVARNFAKFAAGEYLFSMKITSSGVKFNDERNEGTAIELYPNPTKDKIHFLSGVISDVKIYTLTGVLAFASEVYRNSLDIGFLNKGYYTLVFKDANGVVHNNKFFKFE